MVWVWSGLAWEGDMGRDESLKGCRLKGRWDFDGLFMLFDLRFSGLIIVLPFTTARDGCSIAVDQRTRMCVVYDSARRI